MPVSPLRDLSNDVRLATADRARETLSYVRFESALPSSYALQQQGIVTENAVVTPTVQAGSIFNTQQGDYVHVIDYVSTPDGLIAVETTQYDAGAGSQNLVTIGVSDPLAPLSGPRSESGADFDPLAEGESTSPVAADVALTTEQASPEGGDVLKREGVDATGFAEEIDEQGGYYIWQWFNGIDALAAFADQQASLNTGDGEVPVS